MFNISLKIANFLIFFFLLSLIPTCTIHCVKLISYLAFLISCFEFGQIFQKMWLFRKVHLAILFWTRPYLKINKLHTYLVFSNVARPTIKRLHRLNCCSFHRADEFIFVFCTLHHISTMTSFSLTVLVL